MYKLIQLFSLLSIGNLDLLIDELKRIRNRKFNETYKTVKVYPGRRLETTIQNETGFYCYFVPHEYGRGTHIIVIPIKKWSEKLQNELLEKYDLI